MTKITPKKPFLSPLLAKNATERRFMLLMGAIFTPTGLNMMQAWVDTPDEIILFNLAISVSLGLWLWLGAVYLLAAVLEYRKYQQGEI